MEAKEIDWERRRYEIAKTIMTAAIHYDNFIINYSKSFANAAVKYADALIEELKK